MPPWDTYGPGPGGKGGKGTGGNYKGGRGKGGQGTGAKGKGKGGQGKGGKGNKDGGKVSEWAALMIAVLKGNAATVQQLLAAGASPNFCPSSYCHPDSDSGRTDLTQKINECETALKQAAQKVSPAFNFAKRTERHMADQGRHVGILRPPQVALKDLREWTALFLAAWTGNDEIVKLLLTAKASPDLSCNYFYEPHPEHDPGQDWTALLVATERAHGTVVEQLIAARASLDHQEGGLKTALTIAVDEGHWTVMEQLLAARASVEHPINGQALIIAVEGGHDAIVKQLLAANASPDHRNGWRYSRYWEDGIDGQTALMKAADQGNMAILKQLLAAKASPDTQDAHGQTALMRVLGDIGNISDSDSSDSDIAISAGERLAIMKELFAAKASPNIHDVRGQTALMLAIKDGQVDSVKELLAAKASPDIEDRRGLSALMLAVLKAPAPACAALIKAGADINQIRGTPDRRGWRHLDDLRGTALEMVRARISRYGDDAEDIQKMLEEAQKTALLLQVSVEDSELTFRLMSGTVVAQLPCPSELFPKNLRKPLLDAVTESGVPLDWSSFSNLQLVLPNGKLLDFSPGSGSVMEQMTSA